MIGGRRWILLGVVVAAMLTAAPAAGATAWTKKGVPVPSGATASELSGVSCVSPVFCVAVGSSTGASPLIERWDGSSWQIWPAPLASGVLAAVSCSSTSACMAVGTGSERWDGTGWTVEPLAAPAGAAVLRLDGVSYTSAVRCTAVGTDTSGFSLAEGWNGTNWSVQPSPNGVFHDGPNLATAETLLDGVSCTSPGVCAAVGSFDAHNGGYPGIIERWTSSSWALAWDAADQTHPPFTAVGCSADSACTAVGSPVGTPIGDYGGTPVAWRWNGTTWTAESPVREPGTIGTALLGVSCPAASLCAAVGAGRSTAIGAPDGTFAESWDGSTWTAERTNFSSYNGGLSESSLTGVSCLANGYCVAVGADENRRALIEGRGVATIGVRV